ncbi:MAG: phosphodiester glycosidase family protein [Actinomycetota bacterium]|nr:phosphodiester glycosidase family protein [Actinomycetota bacterium]
MLCFFFRGRPLGASRRTEAILTAALAATLWIAGTAPVGVAAAGSRYSRRSTIVREGLVFTRIVDRQGPNRISVLRIDPSTSLTMDVALSNNELPGRETVRSMAARHEAVAAINGNFGNSWGRPLGLLAEDGSLKTSPLSPGGAFAISRRETASYIGRPDLSVTAENLDSGSTWQVSNWNDEYPGPNSISGYTNDGGARLRPPEDSCAVRLGAASALAWQAGKRGVARTYRVERVRCSRDPIYPGKGIVLAADRGSRGARRLATASVGQRVRLGWTTGWAGVMDAMGGTPVLMKDGGVVIEPCSGYVCQRHPRTGVGITASGDVLLVTVDGRQRESIGMTVVEFARLFKYLGATSALNLDGGGSSTMVLKGRVVNSPSDPSGERPVVSALLVLRRHDGGEPAPVTPR